MYNMFEEPRFETHLVYVNQEGRLFLEEHKPGQPHPKEALFYARLPHSFEEGWKADKPTENGVEYLFLTTDEKGAFKVSIGSYSSEKKAESFDVFEGCQFFRDKRDLHWVDPKQKYVPSVCYTFEVYHYAGANKPYDTIEVIADSSHQAHNLVRSSSPPADPKRLDLRAFKWVPEKTKVNPAYEEANKEKQPPLTKEERALFSQTNTFKSRLSI